MTFLTVLGGLVGLATFVVFIMVLVKLFKAEGTLKGILGLICGLYTFIWGWMKHKEQGITNLMWIWTALIIITSIINGIASAQAAGAASY